MRVRLGTDAAAFRALMLPFLRRDPVLNTMMLTRLGYLAANPGQPVTCIAVLDGGDVAGAALANPGHGVFLGVLGGPQAEAVADALAKAWPDLPGVDGAVPAARAFAERWRAGTGRPFRLTGATRLHRLDALLMLGAPGRPRRARPDDQDLCMTWIDAFQRDVGHSEPGLAAATGRAIEERRAWLWEDGGRPVSLLGHQPATSAVVRVGPVYTPDESRGHGYASALTAHVSGLIRDAGDEACLYTDLANPTSNKIYAAIGYAPLADFAQYTFR